MTIEELKTFLSNLTVIEACKLALDLEDAWGIERPGKAKSRVPQPAYGAPMPPGWDRYSSRYEVSYYLASAGDNPLGVMQMLRKHLGWGLQQTKAALSAPKVLLLKTDDREKAQALEKDLEAFGAKIKPE